MDYSPCKMLSLGQKLKMPKRCEKRLFDPIKDVVHKKPLQKTPNIAKKEQFENGQNRPRSMGYSPCKMLSLVQKLKIPKRCEKRLFHHITDVVRNKPLQKTLNIGKKRTVWKWRESATMHGLWPMQNAQFGSKIKNTKKVRKTIAWPN